MADIDMQELRDLLAATVRETVVAVMGAMRSGGEDPWDKIDQDTIDRRNADMERAGRERTAEIEENNARILEAERWANMPADELAVLVEEAKHRRYAEAVASCIIDGRDPLKVDLSGLVEGLDDAKLGAVLAVVADEVATGTAGAFAPSIRGVDLAAVLVTDRETLSAAERP